jgi:hypothetical protein
VSEETRGLSANAYTGPKDSNSDLADRFGSIEDLPAATIRDAQSYVAGRFHTDVTVAAELLDMLGIRSRTPTEGDTP